ncbi:hypothetical protein BC939DRAFT_492653 [Gamsiella multidivaricata]|uniref:uncharacterized protein n=1 Tax=Gamsiella multidivaricata TaxID=101098 RepID=UPI00221EFDD2|nr:uncharacterized protein BC939DRAFT_492653 [Gamsiella multidivaricata]KAI7824352.1 hypothetical protein BC939DRAFT_492653 [Gamsiella multidivaricata]
MPSIASSRQDSRRTTQGHLVMAVLPYPMNSSAIQPSVNTILNLARGCEQHIVRLYYLPTPNTNGFTTSHTIVSTQDSRYYEATTSRNRSYSMPYRRSNSHEQDAIASEHTCRVHQVTRVSESERGIVHLARLRISTMIIATSSLPYLSHLVSLRLQGNQLKDLPLQIFRLPALRELDVSQNFLTEISPLIGLLAPTLEELFLQSNRLKSLPQQLGRLKQLRLLDIADNHLGCIPVEIQRLVSESLAFERGSLWRLSETALSLGNGLEVQAGGEGSHNPQGPMESLFTTAPGQGAPNITPNEDGGHDDDDYVQIRQGMKCWARGQGPTGLCTTVTNYSNDVHVDGRTRIAFGIDGVRSAFTNDRGEFNISIWTIGRASTATINYTNAIIGVAFTIK